MISHIYTKYGHILLAALLAACRTECCFYLLHPKMCYSFCRTDSCTY